jgi:hypothetical protein
MNRRSSPNETGTEILTRRRFLGTSSIVGVTLLAGCTSSSESDDSEGGNENDSNTAEANTDDSNTDGTTDSENDGTEDGTDGVDANAGKFRLLISDQPIAIDEFDSLNVSFDRARIFTAQNEADEEGQEDQEGEEGEEGEESEENEGGEEGEEDQEDQEGAEGDEDEEGEAGREDQEGDEGDGQGGFTVIDLGGATVDLTEVVGDKAISVFEGELSEGRYTKIELHAADVEGIVDGESATVKIPSGKLQITKPFELRAGEEVSFVFDINVVKKGNSGEYNLLPVISGSGVDGEDVDVEEVNEEEEVGEEEGDEQDGEGDEQDGEDDEGGSEEDDGGN